MSNSFAYIWLLCPLLIILWDYLVRSLMLVFTRILLPEIKTCWMTDMDIFILVHVLSSNRHVLQVRLQDKNGKRKIVSIVDMIAHPVINLFEKFNAPMLFDVL